MGIGAAIFLIAVGAILKFAVTTSVSGLNLGVVGVVLMIVGIIGLVLTLVIWAPRRRRAVVEERVVHDGLGRDEYGHDVRVPHSDTVRQREYYDGP
jgi:protein-S-isoprenylcysteine O-methyltransferase Ste14